MKKDKALEEIWEIKDEIYKGVKDMPLDAALETVMKTSRETARKLGFIPRKQMETAIKK